MGTVDTTADMKQGPAKPQLIDAVAEPTTPTLAKDVL